MGRQMDLIIGRKERGLSLDALVAFPIKDCPTLFLHSFRQTNKSKSISETRENGEVFSAVWSRSSVERRVAVTASRGRKGDRDRAEGTAEAGAGVVLLDEAIELEN